MRVHSTGEPNRTRRRRQWALLACVYAGGVLVLSLLPAEGSHLGTTGPLGLLARDRWIHAAGYAVLAVLVTLALDARTDRSLVIVVTIVVVYGASIEGFQAMVSTRTPSVVDASANTLGAVVAVAVRSCARS